MTSNKCINCGYSHDDSVDQNQSRWMAKLNDNTLLSSLSIPGTHDTMSLGWGSIIAQNQAKSLQNQLFSGIRYLDIRLGAYPNYPYLLYSYHGFIYLHSTFCKILDTVTSFLKNHSSETILMRIKQEHTSQPDSIFIYLLKKFLDNTKYSNYLYRGKEKINPILRELRGKFVVLQDFDGQTEWIPYNNNFNIQDDYWVLTDWNLYSKWKKVKAQLYKANQSFIIGSHQKFINYLSGTGGALPFFVASGHICPSTYSPQLPTGLTEPKYHNIFPDFPRVRWCHDIIMIVFEGTNDLTKNYIYRTKPLYVGIVVSDFPGQGLINNIISVNFNREDSIDNNFN